jgi:predicted enzyme related to lactoylglutathione lyase
MANSVGLEHVGIRAQGADFAKVLDFYGQAFGFTPFREMHEPFHLAFMANAQGDMIEVLDLDGPPLQGPSHLSFAVPLAELEPLRARVVALGVTLDEPLNMPTGDVIYYFNDPAGNRAQIIGRAAPFGP